MQDLTLTFTSTRERRTSDDTLRDQLSFIAKRALAGNRGRGLDFEEVGIEVVNGAPDGYSLTGKLRFFRRIDVAEDVVRGGSFSDDEGLGSISVQDFSMLCKVCTKETDNRKGPEDD